MAVMELYVLLGMISAAFIGGGRVLEKRGVEDLPNFSEKQLLKDGKLQFSEIRKALKKLLNSYFLSGVFLDVAGWLLTLKALAIGFISIIQPLKAFGNLVAVLLGVIWLKENLDPSEYLGIGLIVVGTVLINMVA